MPTANAEDTVRLCTACGNPLMPGPLGLQCPRCLFAFAAVESDDAEQVAALFPELRIEGEIARGGFSTVFRAEHRRMRRPVALKFLDSALARSPEAVALFEREMIHGGALDHPGIVRAYDAGERDGHWFIVMELIDGLDCGALVRRDRTLPLAESCEIIRQAALALHHAHGQGLVHRDVKPGNLMVTRGSHGAESYAVKVLDFGLAMLAMAPLFAESDDRFLGTLEYVAPEQIETPNRVDARADIYSLGATLRRMLTGQPLRAGGSEHSLFQRMKSITTEAAEPLARLRPDLPAAFARLCDELIALDPAARLATAEELAHRLAPWCEGTELARLFEPGPHPERPFPRAGAAPRRRGWPRALRRAVMAGGALLLLALLILFPSFRPYLTWYDREQVPSPLALPPLPPPTPSPEGWRPIFSASLARDRVLDAATAPRLIHPDWEVESEFFTSDSMYCGRPLPGGGFASLEGPGAYARVRARGNMEPRVHEAIEDRLQVEVRNASYLAVAPDTGHFIWSRQQDPAGLHLGRARPDGTLLPPLRYDFAAEFPPGLYNMCRSALVAAGKTVADGYPWGFAFVTAGQEPPDTGLRAGDVLVADQGHREFFKGGESRPGVWRCRFDTEDPARRFGSIPRGHYPCDVATARSGVYLLARTNYLPVGPITDADRSERVYRWTPQGFRACLLDRPIYDPCGIAADPLSEDLFVAQGGLIPSATLLLQQVFRLRPVPGDPYRYKVEVVAERFGKLSACCLAFTLDGRLVITDSGNRVIVVLKRRAAPAVPAAAPRPV